MDGQRREDMLITVVNTQCNRHLQEKRQSRLLISNSGFLMGA
ncbi:MAG: hypothetical protein QNJ01_10360 [Desulfobacterales bacterium]|nr:hypothetical protein [Desulfobacterales bacterium]